MLEIEDLKEETKLSKEALISYSKGTLLFNLVWPKKTLDFSCLINSFFGSRKNELAKPRFSLIMSSNENTSRFIFDFESFLIFLNEISLLKRDFELESTLESSIRVFSYDVLQLKEKDSELNEIEPFSDVDFLIQKEFARISFRNSDLKIRSFTIKDVDLFFDFFENCLLTIFSIFPFYKIDENFTLLIKKNYLTISKDGSNFDFFLTDEIFEIFENILSDSEMQERKISLSNFKLKELSLENFELKLENESIKLSIRQIETFLIFRNYQQKVFSGFEIGQISFRNFIDSMKETSKIKEKIKNRLIGEKERKDDSENKESKS